MILIADSGSTKTEWSLVMNERNFITEKGITQTYTTSGINPFFQDSEEIFRILETQLSIPKGDVSNVFFYGSGCIPEKIPAVSEVLEAYFGIKEVSVYTDLLAAARSLCQNRPGIACILGTGSNSCFYDGNVIAQQVSPLGFILGDEGSGAVLGKRLLADILKNQLPKEIIANFFETYSITPSEILDWVYNGQFPNRFMAGYCFFIKKHIDNPVIANLVETSFNEFIERNIMQYEAIGQSPVHFTGGIAFHFRENLVNVLKAKGLEADSVTRSPMEGLIKYHIDKQIPVFPNFH